MQVIGFKPSSPCSRLPCERQGFVQEKSSLLLNDSQEREQCSVSNF